MWTLGYVALIVLVNYGFSVVPLVPMPTGEMWPPMSLAVGLVFVARDFAQREVGHRVLLAMLAGCALSYWLADPYVAVASVVAFLVSESADWAFYTLSRRPFHERVLWSSALATPIDSAVFLGMIGHLSEIGVVAMVASKMLGALAVWWVLRRRISAAGVPAVTPTAE
jgi:queuosine precursor transporter